MNIDKIFLSHLDNLDLFLDKSTYFVEEEPKIFTQFLGNFFINFHFKYNNISLELFEKIIGHSFYKNFFSQQINQESLIYFILNNFIDFKNISKIPNINLTDNLSIFAAVKNSGKGIFLPFLEYCIEEKFINLDLIFNDFFVDDLNIFKFLIDKVDSNELNNKFVKNFLLNRQLKNLNKKDIFIIKKSLIRKKIFFSATDIVNYYYDTLKFNTVIYDCICEMIEEEEILNFFKFLESKSSFSPSKEILDIIKKKKEKYLLTQKTLLPMYEKFLKKKNLEKEFLSFINEKNISKL